jgi:peptidylprolyl isomerase/FKBP-type peptidyl-prolyl cis-trans isomerase FklB
MKKFAFAVIGLALLTACATVPPPPPTPPATVAGPDFLARNGAAKGVLTTASGLQYFIIASGPVTGPHPAATDTVSFDYDGTLTTGEKFDSSFDRGEPLTGQVDGFVPGFTEALMLMRPGDEWVVWIPPALGYGAEDKGPIPGNSVLRFRLALHSVTPTPVAAVPTP